MLLAYEAAQRMDLPETRGTLLAATLVNPRLITFLHGHQAAVSAVAFARDSRQVAAGDYNGNIVLWNNETHRPNRALRKIFGKGAVRSVSFSANGKYMAASGTNGAIML